MKSDNRFWQVEGRTSRKRRHTGLTTLFEASKAILFLMLGCRTFDLIHKNVDAVAERIAFMFLHQPLSNAFTKFSEPRDRSQVVDSRNMGTV
jgi:hypothetical protein